MQEIQVPLYMGPTQKTVDMLKWVNRPHIFNILPTQYNHDCLNHTNQYLNGSLNMFSFVIPYVNMQLSEARKSFSTEFSNKLSSDELAVKESLEKSCSISSSENIRDYWPNALYTNDAVHSYNGYIDELADSLNRGFQGFPESDSLSRYVDGYNTLVKEINSHWQGFYTFEVPKSE